MASNNRFERSRFLYPKADVGVQPQGADQRQTTADGPPTGSDRPTPDGGHSELPADKRPVAACGKLIAIFNRPAESQGVHQMSLDDVRAVITTFSSPN
jgi:hypothetical protein